MNISLLSLGCPKNSVDSDNLLKGLSDRGVVCTAGPEEADIMLVNTCGFIEEAKRESIGEILRLARLKAGGRRLLVFGCLAQRYGEELKREIPEIDAIFGVGEEDEILRYCTQTGSALEGARPVSGQKAFPQRSVTSYIKVAEGCDRGCSFCVIPSIRGAFRSRSPEAILREADSLVGSGSRELVLIAQDLTGYGKDLRGYGLCELLRDMASISGEFWIRLLYLYPTSIEDGLLEAVASEEKICRYMDMPLQHSEDGVLRSMRRGGSRQKYRELVEHIRQRVPDVALRTTFMVGFPGESGEDFRGLMEFVEETRFERMGVFKYSKEEGTPSASMRGQVPERTKEMRLDSLMRLQAEVSLEKNRAMVGRKVRALVEGVEGLTALGRIYSQAPEIDGLTFINGDGLKKGQFVDIEITRADYYDLEGAVAGK
jgi:ribosomal protein S12 methylthiotransferase